MSYSLPLAKLIESFQRLPGIGPKSAQRLAFHVLKQPTHEVQNFSQALVQAKELIHPCPVCFHLTAETPCGICTDEHRERGLICVVPEPSDVFAMQRNPTYRGLFHVLGGLISPIDGMGPEDLHLQPLLDRITQSNPAWLAPLSTWGLSFPPVEEVILALPPSTEGDTTSLYMNRLIKAEAEAAGRSVPVITRIAFGLPVGGDLEYADSMTLNLALQGRHAM